MRTGGHQLDAAGGRRATVPGGSRPTVPGGTRATVPASPPLHGRRPGPSRVLAILASCVFAAGLLASLGGATHVGDPPDPMEVACPDVVFFDEFLEPIDEDEVLAPFAAFDKWDATGSINLIGPHARGGYASTAAELQQQGGVMGTKQTFTLPQGATVTVQWLRAGDQGQEGQDPGDTMAVTLGTWTVSENLLSSTWWGASTHTFTMAASETAKLSFTSKHPDEPQGILIDRVRLCVKAPAPTSSTTSATGPPPNTAPTLEPVGARSVRAGEELCFNLVAHDREGSVQLGASGLPAGATFSTDSGTFCWRPAAEQAGDHCTLRFTATDAAGAQVSQSVCLHVYQAVEDRDRDGVEDPADVCPDHADYSQADSDGDGRGDACDTAPCDGPSTPGRCSQEGQGQAGVSAVSDDRDQDGIPDRADNCASAANHGQEDFDADRTGDACDDDADGDGAAERAPGGQDGFYLDNCPMMPNDQVDSDGDGVGDACAVAPQPSTTCPCPTVVAQAPVQEAAALGATLLVGLSLATWRRRLR